MTEIVRQRNQATYIVFPIIDKNGNLVSGAAGLDSEIDQWNDGTAPDGYADCTNEATEIGTSGTYYLLLTAEEMNFEYVVLKITSTTANALTQIILIRTIIGDPANAATTTSGIQIDVEAGGTVGVDFSNINGTLDAAEIGTDAITAAKLAADAVNEIRDSILNDATRFAGADIALIKTETDKIQTIDDNVDAVLADTNEIQGKLPTNYIMGSSVQSDKDDEIDAIKAKTDNLPADPTSETNATANTNSIIAEINANEAKIDIIDTNVDTIVGKLPMNYIMGSFVQSDKDDEIDAIKAKTDNLPADPTSETNATSNTNSIISEINANEAKIDIIDTNVDGIVAKLPTNYIMGSSVQSDKDDEIDAIKAKTDNLPVDPASETNATSNTNTIVSEINTNEAKIDTVDTNVDTIVSKLPTNYIMGSSVLTAKDDEIDAIKAKTDNLPADPTSETNATANKNSILAEIDVNQTAIESIQNNTTVVAVVPQRLIRPDTGSKTYRLTFGLYDTSGNPEAPDSDPTIQVENESGTERLAEASMTQFTGQTGQYYYDYTITSTTTLERLIFRFKVIESSVTKYYRRSSEITEFETALNEIQSNVTAIKTKTDNLPVDPAAETNATSNRNTIVAEINTNETKIDIIDGNVDTITGKLPTNYIMGSSVASDKDDEIDGIAAKTTQLNFNGNNVLSEVANKGVLNDPSAADITGALATTHGAGSWETADISGVSSDVTGIKERTDRIPDTPAAVGSEMKLENNAITDVKIANNAVENRHIKPSTITESLFWNGAISSRVAPLLDVAVGTRASENNATINYGNLALTLTAHSSTLGMIQGKTDNLPADPTSETVATANKNEIISEIQTTEPDLDPVIDAIADVSGLVTEVKEKTDNLPVDPASETLATANKDEIVAAIPDDYALEATLGGVESLLSGEISDVHTLVGDVKAKTDNLPADPTSEAVATANKNEVISAVETTEPDLTPVLNALDDVTESMTRALGLLHENVRVTNTFVGGNHTGSTVRIYDSKENAEIEEETGIVATYTLVVEYNEDDQPESYKMVKE